MLIIQASIQHLLELIEEVLDLARIESGRLRLSLEPVQPRLVIDESLALIESAAAERQVTLIPSRLEYWMSVGAKASERVQVFLKKYMDKFRQPAGEAKKS